MSKKYSICINALATLAMSFLIMAPFANADLLGGGDTTPPVVTTPAPIVNPPTPPAETITPPVTPILTPPSVEVPPTPQVQEITPPSDTTPPVISGVANTSISDIAATIVWLTNEAAVSTFEYGTTSNYGSSANLSASALLAHAAILSNLSPNTTYYYCVHATDLSGNVSSACGQSFTTAALTDTVPPLISAIIATSLNNSSETINWTTSEVADSQIEYGTTRNYGSTTTLNSTLGVTHNQTLNNLTPETLYHYRVLSKDVAGNLTTSSDQTFSTAVGASVALTDTIPPVISGFANSELGSNTATLIWTTNELASSTLEYGTSTSYGSQAQLEPDTLLAHSATLTNLLPSTNYYYCIHATDLFHNTANSCGHHFITEAASVLNQASGDTTPPVISGIANTSLTEAAATIVWTTDELSSSTLEYGTTNNYGSQQTLSTSLLLAHSATLTGLLPNTTYYYCVHATDLAGNTANACGQQFTTAHLSADTTPPIISAIVNTSFNATSGTITWATNEPSDSQIEYGRSTDYGSTTSLNSMLGLTHSQTLEGLTTGVTYHYRVLSKDASGNLSTSGDYTFTAESVSVNIPATPVPAPIISSLNVNTTQNSATVSWSTNIAADSHLEYGLNSAYDNQTTEDTALVTSHSQTINNLAAGTSYNFRILSQSINSEETVSTNHTFTTQISSNFLPNNNTNSIPAEILPNIITNLWTTDIGQNTITVNFSELNNAQNEALQYDIRYSTTAITDNNFSAATPASETPVYFDSPESGASITNQYVILGLNPNTKDYFAIKTKDQNGNNSPISQVIFATTTTQSNNSANNNSNTVIENPINNYGSTGSPGGNLSSVGIGSGGNATYFTGGINPPQNARITAADSSAILFWDNPSDPNFTRVQVVRSTNEYPASVNDGQIIYEGAKSGFTDINLANGQKYYYSIFAFNHLSHISAPLKFAVTPQASIEQIELLKNPGSAVCNGEDLSFGMHSDAVRQLQQYLDSFSSIAYPQKLITGYFHKYTLAAIKQLQNQYGLPQTGIWDAATRMATGICFNNLAQPKALLNRDLSFGSRGDDVVFLKKYLINLGLLDPKHLTNFFGQFTKTAVIKLQQNNNIQPANRIVGADTRNLILSGK